MKNQFKFLTVLMLSALPWFQSSFIVLAKAKTSILGSGITAKSALAPMATFAVTFPTASTVVTEGSSLTVIWDVAGTNLAPISASSVSIFLSVDAFPQSYALLLNTPNDGSQTVTLPVGSKSNTAKISVSGNGSSGIISASSVNFSIGGSYCFPSGGCNSGFGNAPIQSFQITNSTGTSTLLNNSNTGCGIAAGNTSYSNYGPNAALRPNLVKGTTYRLVSTGCTGPLCFAAGYGYYIDLNRDGRFNGTGEYLGGTDPATGSVALNWTVPTSYSEGYYRFRVKSESGRKPLAAEACGGFTYAGEAEDYFVFISGYCSPNYQNDCNLGFINSFSLGTFSRNNSGCADQGLSGNYSLTTGPGLLDNQSYPFSVSIGGSFGATHVGIFIDFNNDLDFNDAGESVYTSSAPSLTHSGTIAIPAGITGLRRMRVRSTGGETISSTGACVTFSRGETEDYTLSIGSGEISSAGNQTICNGGDPANITFATTPATGSTYQWFSQAGLISAPATSAATTGWTLISTATGSSYNPPAGPTANITYACRITLGGVSRWANGVRQVTVLPAVNFGTLSSGNQTFNETGNASLITFSTAPSGGNGTFAYRWYQADGLQSAPTGTTIPSNWTLISGASSSSYDPPAVFRNTSYAAMVDPTGTQNCGGFTWASGVRQINITNGCASTFCRPNMTAAPFLYINSASLGSNTTTSGNNNGYGFYSYTNYYTTGQAVTFTLQAAANTTLVPTTQAYYRIFADWNKNGVIDEFSDLVFASLPVSPLSSVTGSFTIPTSAVGGRTIIRVSLTTFNTSSACWSSSDLESGEIEDYCIYVSKGLNPGTISGAAQNLCSGSIPGSMSVTGFSPATATFQWYSKDVITSSPAASEGLDGFAWTFISGANSSTYTPTSTFSGSRTFACRVSANGSTLWASGVRQVDIKPAVNFGTLASGNQNAIGSIDPSPITFSPAPTGGSGSFTYQWYRASGVVAAPTGTAIPAGWTLLSGQTASSYDPPLTESSLSFAVQVNPSGTPDCGVATWAAGVRQIIVNPFSPGTLAAGNQTICNGAGPASILFSAAPTTGSTYQWYFRDALVAAPANTDPIGTWQILTGQTGSFLTPGATSNSRTFACRVTNGANSQWATGVRQVTVLPVFNSGTLIANQTLCAPYDPAPITMATNPVGSGQYKWDWYYVENTTATCPTVASSTSGPSGWTTSTTDTRFFGTSPTGVGISFDPSSAGTNGRTWVLRIIPQANGTTPACGTAKFTNCHRTFRSTTCREAVDEMVIQKDNLELGQNNPNPFSDETSIAYFIPEGSGDGQLEIVSLQGKILYTEGVREASKGEVTLRKGMLSAGTYFYQIRTPRGLSIPRKMVVQ